MNASPPDSLATRLPIRIGQGLDSHRLELGKPLILAGITIQSPWGCVAHSDGDALWHAVMDALLGALALGDIGEHFPPSDEHYRNANSGTLATQVMALVDQHGYRVGNVDCTIRLEAPKLGPYKDTLRHQLATVLDCPMDWVSIKAKTGEGVDAVGTHRAIEVYAIVTLLSQ